MSIGTDTKVFVCTVCIVLFLYLAYRMVIGF